MVDKLEVLYTLEIWLWSSAIVDFTQYEANYGSQITYYIK